MNTFLAGFILLGLFLGEYSYGHNGRDSRQLESVSIIENILEVSYQDLRHNNKVMAWEVFSPRDRIPYYCRDLCWCISEGLSSSLRKQIKDIKFYQMRASALGGFYIQRNYGQKVWYAFHVVLAVQFSKNDVRIVDPLIFGDVKLHSLHNWKGRFESLETIQFSTFN